MLVRPRTFTLHALFTLSALQFTLAQEHYNKEELIDLGNLGGEETIGVFRFKVPVKKVTVTKTYGVPIPVPYPIKQEVPVPVHITKPILIPVPHAVHVPHPVPVIKTVAIPAQAHHDNQQGHVADSSSLVPGIIALPYAYGPHHGHQQAYGVIASPIGFHRFFLPPNAGHIIPQIQANAHQIQANTHQIQADTQHNVNNQDSYKTDETSNEEKRPNENYDKRST